MTHFWWIFLKIHLFLFYVYEYFAYMYLCTTCVPCAIRIQKKATALGLELQMMENHHEGAEN